MAPLVTGIGHQPVSNAHSLAEEHACWGAEGARGVTACLACVLKYALECVFVVLLSSVTQKHISTWVASFIRSCWALLCGGMQPS